MKVLVADKLEQGGIDALTPAGGEVVYRAELKDGHEDILDLYVVSI